MSLLVRLSSIRLFCFRNAVFLLLGVAGGGCRRNDWIFC
ncbi:unnamed protein product [Nippostrongylus brasiliensis]|uniref:Uncharacterized protein n=1 Tax=Nippostrongylus brasiliensis TaxID=27835 RepID=A0A0N4XZY6_NIPBR|nr:unnamed protein product [Nippostrongylus brasiliensis]